MKNKISQEDAEERVRIKHKLRRFGAIGWKNRDSMDDLRDVLEHKIEQLKEELLK